MRVATSNRSACTRAKEGLARNLVAMLWPQQGLSVPPGLACISQVSGRNHIAFDKWMRLDVRDVDHRSLKEDVGLVFWTLPAMSGERAAS